MLNVPANAIRSLIEDCLAAGGLPQEDAARCAELMAEADLTGADGVFRLPQYGCRPVEHDCMHENCRLQSVILRCELRVRLRRPDDKHREPRRVTE